MTDSTNPDRKLIAPLITSVVVTLFLFYIDEGYNNFNWMNRFGNWIPFVVYVATFFTVLFFSFRFLQWERSGILVTIAKYLVGTTLGFAVVCLILLACFKL